MCDRHESLVKKRPVTGLQAACDGDAGIKALTAAFAGD